MKQDPLYCLTISASTILVIIGYILLPYDKWLALWLLGCFVVNYFLGKFINWLHKSFDTERNVYFYLKNLGNLFELGVYSFLIAFQIYTVLAGILAIKAVGSIGDKTKRSHNDDERSVKIVAIYRLGFVLQLILAFIFAFVLWKSNAYVEVKSLHLISFSLIAYEGVV